MLERPCWPKRLDVVAQAVIVTAVIHYLLCRHKRGEVEGICQKVVTGATEQQHSRRMDYAYIYSLGCWFEMSVMMSFVYVGVGYLR